MLAEPEKLDALLTQALFDRAAMDEALREISRLTDAPGAQLISTTPGLDIQESSIVGDFDQTLLSREADYWDRNPRARAIPSMAPLQSIQDQDVIDPRAINRDATYQELLIPCGMAFFTGVLVEKSADSIVALAVHRAQSQGAFEEAQARTMEQVARRLLPLLDLARMMTLRDGQVAIGAQPGDAAVAVLDTEGRIKDCSANFSKLIADGTVRQNIQGRLALRFPDASFSAVSPREAPEVFPVFAEDRNIKYVGRILRIPISGFSFWGPRYLLSLKKRNATSPLDPQTLQRLLALTPAEAEVACALASGLSLDEVSEKRATSYQTTRAILKSIFRKTDCRRQTDLIRLVYSLTQ